jgi:hypothetical protein
MTTVVDPIVSARVGNETFFNSPLTSLKNSRMELVNLVNILTPSAHPTSPLLLPAYSRSATNIEPDPSATQRLAGALGFEPRLSVLETDVLAIDTMPLRRLAAQPLCRQPSLLHFLMGIVFPAELAELIPLQPIRVVLLILHSGIVPLLADRACQIDDLSHLSLLVRREA